MATVAQLNVEIAARIGELQKGLSAAQRELRNAGKQFGAAGKKAGEDFSKNLSTSIEGTGATLSKIGTSLTQSISLPLALMGGAAIQAAGQFESLKLAMEATFKNAGRSVAEAHVEVEALRKAALAPGLDFQQAISASIRLQSVGLSAEKARNVIIELANAVASTGGTAENLSSVTVQMSQMISKGKVLSQDLRIIQENLPIISDLMLKAFGTSNAEAIQALGLTGKQFVEGITKEMTKLNRVEGGISNAIVNAGSAIKQFLANIGDELNKVFNIGDKSDRFAAFLQDATKWFQGLSNSTKEMAAGFGLALLAAGPLIKVFSVLNSGALQLVGGFRSAFGAIEVLNAGMTAMEAAAIRVKLAFGIIGIVAALGVAIYTMSDSFDAATFAADKFQNAQSEIISQTAKEIGTVNQLFAAVKDETKSKFEKGQSIDKLLKLYPDYFKGMDLEGASVARLTELQNGLNGSILRGVAERKKAEAVNSIYEKQAEIITRIQQLKEGGAVTASEAGLINTGDMIRAGSIASAVIEKMQAQSSDLGNQVEIVSGQFDRAFGSMAVAIDPVLKKEYDLRDAYYAEKDGAESNIKTTVKHVATTKEITAAKKAHNKEIKDAAAAQKEETDALERYDKMIREIKNAWVAEAQAMQDALDVRAKEGNPTDTTPLSPGGEAPLSIGVQQNYTQDQQTVDKKIADAEKYAQTIKKIQEDLSNGNATFSESFKSTQEAIIANGTLLENVFVGMGAAIQDAAANGASSFKQLGLAAAGAAAKIVRAYIQQGVAAAVAKALSSIPFPFNLAAAAAAGGIAAALFTNLIGKIGVKGFAAGTRDAPGGLSLVGERGPELVNLPKHSQVFSAGQTATALRGGGSNVNVTGEFRVQGTDLVLVLERTQNKLSRFR